MYTRTRLFFFEVSIEDGYWMLSPVILDLVLGFWWRHVNRTVSIQDETLRKENTDCLRWRKEQDVGFSCTLWKRPKLMPVILNSDFFKMHTLAPVTCDPSRFVGLLTMPFFSERFVSLISQTCWTYDCTKLVQRDVIVHLDYLSVQYALTQRMLNVCLHKRAGYLKT